jgi:hypothetical protein
MVLIFGAAATAQDDATSGDQNMRRAYDTALRCFVANGNIYSEFKKAGDVANARLFDAKAKRAFDVAKGDAIFLHLDSAQVTADVQQAMDTELPKLVRDGGYLTTVAKDCKREGLM